MTKRSLPDKEAVNLYKTIGKNVKKFMRYWSRMTASRDGVTVLIWLNMI